ncbi:hypothetical protein CXG81DRAFT_12818, partial [Caulochytrium protostelioides]
MRRAKLTQMYIRAASNGDMALLSLLFRDYEGLFDADGLDEDGSPAIVYAACFGHTDAVALLVENGVRVDGPDRNGWTALMWACNNHLAAMARLLVASGANKTDDEDDEAAVGRLAGSASMASISMDRVAEPPFEWNKCQPDQMFVFDEKDIDWILDITTEKIRPTRATLQSSVAASILFLCARYAHYWNTADLLSTFMERAVDAVIRSVRQAGHDTVTVAYWLANLTQLLYFLKRDPGLLVATGDAQAVLSELTHELFGVLVKGVERRLAAVLHPALLDHEQIESSNGPPRYENMWTGFNRRRALFKPASNPATVTAIFESLLAIARAANLHPEILAQALTQLFHYLGAELFNRIISNREYCCRARAVQIRANLSSVENWVREYASSLPVAPRVPLRNYLRPAVHLTSFLQVCSSLEDVAAFHATRASLTTLTLVQFRKAIENYKYEVGEPSPSEDIERY